MNSTNSSCPWWTFYDSIADDSNSITDEIVLIFPSLLLPIGLLLAFFGYRVTKISLALVLGFTGAFTTLYFANSDRDSISCEALTVFTLIISFILAFLARMFLNMAIFLLGAVAGGILANYIFVVFPEFDTVWENGGMILNKSIVPYWITIGSVSILVGYSTTKYEESLIKVGTSIIGGIFISLFVITVTNVPNWAAAAIGLPTAVLGYAFQVYFKRLCKTKKQVVGNSVNQDKNDSINDKIPETKVTFISTAKKSDLGFIKK